MGEVVGVCRKCGARGASLEFRHVYTVDGHEVEIYCLICGNSLATMPIKKWEERIEMSKIGDCKKCGKKRVSLPARGLCSVCYRAEREAERAAENVTEVDCAKPEPAPVFESPYETDDYEELLEDAANEQLDAIAEDQVAAVLDRPAADFPALLDATLADLRKFLIAKNRAYGNSALEPVRVFSKADPVEQLRVRIDDKLSRLLRGADCGEDTEMDLLGYLALLQVARRWPSCTSAATGARKA